ncbi:MAG: acetyl-coenzyme A synthetase N-terminal domain-containing protein, partial [Pseudomonadota bacterium]|nr:acetyl-coenzyme A synthetase N-terminal domain-containing protein [Pseudomonadota bacterium]
MSDLFDIPANIAERCLIDPAQYQSMYKQSIEDPDAFWSEQAGAFLDWIQPWTQVSEAD